MSEKPNTTPEEKWRALATSPLLKIGDTIREKANIYKGTLAIIPDYEKQIEEYGANLQLSTLANALPKLVFENNKEIEKEFKKIALKTRLLESYQKLEYELYKKGIKALGVFNNRIVLGDVLSYQETPNESGDLELTYLLLRISTQRVEKTTFEELIEFDLNKPIAKQYLKTIEDNKVDITDKLLIDKDYKQEKNVGFIPFVIFKNRADARRDLELVNSEFLQAINKKIEQLQLDAYYSTPLPITFNVASNGYTEGAIKALFSLGEGRIFTYNRSALEEGVAPFTFASSPSQSGAIMDNIESLTYQIKKFLLFKVDSSDSGTHNMHNVEAQQLNSDYEDYIESKANLREIYFKDLTSKLLRYFNKLQPSEELDFDVIVVGSTKWREENAKIAQTNQQGSLINQGINQKQPVEESSEQTKEESE